MPTARSIVIDSLLTHVTLTVSQPVDRTCQGMKRRHGCHQGATLISWER